MNNKIGASICRYDAFDKVTGKAKYAQDIDLPGQLTLRCVFAMHPHAIIDSINTDKAMQAEGVVAILTAADVPCNEYGLITNDQPVLCGPGSGKAGAAHVRYIGDRVALIIAEDEACARRAEALLEIRYTPLPVISDPETALADPPVIIPPGRDNNIQYEKHIELGNTAESFSGCAVIIESRYTTSTQEHAYLQTEAGIAYLQDGQIVVNTAGQWAHHDKQQIAHALQMPEERIRVIYSTIGGAFGGKEDISVQIMLALAVHYLNERGIQRPVKMVWSRKESFIGHHKRHPFTIDAKWGARKDGRILAADMRMLADCGAYASSSEAVLSVAASLATGPYSIPNVRVDAVSVYTNNIPNGAFRGFGAPQATFAAEMQINKIAEALDMDPVEIRLINSIQEGQDSIAGQPLPAGISIEKVIRTCAEKSCWDERGSKWRGGGEATADVKGSENKRTGTGFASGFKSFGIPPDACWAIVELDGLQDVERVLVRHGGADLGQGSYSVFRQMAAQALDVPIDMVTIDASDTATSLDAGSTSASRMTFMAGNAIIGAAKIAQEKWAAEERPAVGRYEYKPRVKGRQGGAADPHQLFGFGYIAQTAQVEVDMDTGQVKVMDLVCANDVGKAINPQQVIGQMAGSIVQAQGFTLMENLVQEAGYLKTHSLATYLVPTIMDIPARFDAIIVETPDPLGPYGARGMAEMPFGVFAPAVAAALHDATGVWFDDLPITAEKVVRALEKGK